MVRKKEGRLSRAGGGRCSVSQIVLGANSDCLELYGWRAASENMSPWTRERQRNGFCNTVNWGSDLYRKFIGLFKEPCWLIKWEQWDLSVQYQWWNPQLQPFISGSVWKKIWGSSSVASPYLCNHSVWAAYSHYAEEAPGRRPTQAERWCSCCQKKTWSVFIKKRRRLSSLASAVRTELRCREMVTKSKL